MRVIHVITRLIVGGAQENTIASVLGLRRKPGLDVSLLSGPTRGPEGSLERLFAPCPHALGIVPPLIRPINPLLDWLAYRQLVRRFRSAAPLLVHTHSGKAGVLGRLAAARAGVPLVVHTIHGPSFGPFQGPLSNLLLRSAERLAARYTVHFVVVANAMKEQYLAAGIGTPSQYTRIFSGFPLEPFLAAGNDDRLRADLGFTPQHIVVGKIARLVPRKGHEDLLAVAPRLVRECPALRFLLVGDGGLRARYEQQARSMGLQEHFVFTGLVPPERMPALVGVMDLLVHLSAREGLPRALPQALAAGKPVVAYDRDGAREICVEGRTGFLLPPGDRDGLAARVLSLAGDPGRRAALGAEGRQFVTEHFSVERMVDELHDLYLRLAAARGSTLPREG